MAYDEYMGLRYCLFGLILCSMTATGQEPATVTFRERAAPLKRLLPALEKVLHRHLSVSPILEDQVFIVAADNVSPSELLAKIAESADAEWVDTAQGMLLTRTDKKQSQVEQKEWNAARQEAKIVIAKWKEKAAALTPFDEARALALTSQYEGLVRSWKNPPQENWYQQQREADAETPGGRAVLEIAAAMPPEEIASTMPGERAVFTFSPTKAQRPLPTGSDEIVRNAVREQQKWSSVAQAAIAKLDLSQWPFGKPWLPLPDDSPTAKLSIERHFEGQIDVQLTIGDKNWVGATGGRVIEDYAMLDAKFDLAEYKKATPFTLSPASAALADFWNGGRKPGTLNNPQVLEALSTPARHEVSEFILSDAVFQLAHMDHKKYLVRVDDTMAVMALGTGHRINAPMTRFILHDLGAEEVLDENGWCVTRFRRPIHLESKTWSRAAMETLVTTMRSEQRLGLVPLTKFLSTTTGDIKDIPLTLYVAAFSPEYSAAVPRDMALNVARLFGTLSDEQRAALIAGKPLLFSMCSEPQQQLFAKVLFGTYERGDYRQGAKDEEIRDMRHDATFVYGDGIPGGTALYADVRQVTAALSMATNAKSYGPQVGVKTAEEIASNNVMSQVGSYKNMFGAFDSFKPATRIDWHFHLQFDPLLTYRWDLQDVIFDGHEPWRPLDGMPAAFVEDYKKKFDLYMQAEKWRAAQQQGNTPPP